MPSPRTIAPALILLAAGCSNPLFPKESDYGKQANVERLRQVQPLNIDKLEKPPPPPGTPEPDLAKAAAERFASASEVPLTLETARADALENNLDIKVAQFNPTIAQQQVDIEESKFEAAFTTKALWQQIDAPTDTELTGTEQQTRSIEPGVTIPLRTGGTANVSLPVSRTETNNSFSILNPAYQSDLNFSISQPLLRNAGREVATTSIRIASYNRQISETQTKLAIINQLAAVDRAYWQLYQDRRDLDVRQQQYDLATAQLEKARRLVGAGKQAEIEVIRAEAGVAQRLDAIIRSANNILSQQRDLKRIINAPGLQVDQDHMVIPKTEPRPVEYLVDRPSLTAAAIDNRMEMLEFELQLLQDAANIRFAENQTLPQLDVSATYGLGGLGASQQDNFHTLEKHKFDSWSLGANLTVPLGNEGPKAALRQSVLTRLQRLSSRDARKLLIRQEVADTVDRIQAGWERILATRQSTILSTRELHAEQRQFDVGLATSTDVLDAASRLALAQLDEIQAVTDYQIAQVDLAVATGTYLGAAHILWQPVPRPPASVTPDMLKLPPDAGSMDTQPPEIPPGGAAPAETPPTPAEQPASPPAPQPATGGPQSPH